MKENTKPERVSTDMQITLDQGKAFIHDYNVFMQEYPFPDGVSRTVACHITRKDLMAMLNDVSNDGIRCYFGKRYSDHVQQEVFCLVMVGTHFENGCYYDIIRDDKLNSGVYEFTTPCPDTCDTASPLYQATLTSDDMP